MRVTSPWNERSRHPAIWVSNETQRSPEEAWELVQQLISERRRGEVVHRDRRAHQVLKLLGGSAAYDAVAAEPGRIAPRFLEAYRLLGEIDERMRRLGEVVGAAAPAAGEDARSKL